MSETTESIRRHPGDLAQWIGVLTGPIVWLLQLQVNYSLVQTACETGRKWPLHVVSLLALLLVTAAAAVSWRLWKRLPEGSTEEGPPRETRSRFMALCGLVTSALFALVIVAMEIPNWVLHACD